LGEEKVVKATAEEIAINCLGCYFFGDDDRRPRMTKCVGGRDEM
jgi:hypothetical protein